MYDAGRGLLVTNAHVVAEAKTVKVGFNQSTLTDATIVGVDLKHDVAVLRVRPGQLAGLRTLPRAKPASVQQGETAYALGFEGDGNSNFLERTVPADDRLGVGDGRGEHHRQCRPPG